ncbi:peptidase M23 [Streptomyces formicae]|uniref:Peptidase M23 n=1 Tax=Streptomyces formicae TaxID=1616117 RepID=A0ABY3WKS2_9ACTN|nr:peptidase M23 [Streptomyces formicae]UNM13204.1 peptidase M23 [Streptomyces formicae]
MSLLASAASGFASGFIYGLGGMAVRATLVLHDPPAGKKSSGPGKERGRLVFGFNPEQLRVDKSAGWVRHKARRAHTATRPEFVGSQPRSLSLEIFLDAEFERSVQDHVEVLMGCCTPTPESVAARRPSPPWVRLQWGRLQSTAFTAVVTHVDANYTMFAADGLPLRAQCTMGLEEVGGPVARQNPTSGGLGGAGSHVLVQGESLASLAYRQYGDPAQWREVAQFNGIDDPAEVVPGERVVLPALAGEAGGGLDG